MSWNLTSAYSWYTMDSSINELSCIDNFEAIQESGGTLNLMLSLKISCLLALYKNIFKPI